MRWLSGERSVLDQGLDAFAAKQWRRARRLLEDAAIEERPRAIGDYHLGVLYWRGLGGEADREAAVQCFSRAAESGHAAAQTALGLALQAGIGVPRDLEKARMLFRSAAGAGDAEAMTRLAPLSEANEGQALLERAADAGYGPAMLLLSDALLTSDPIEALVWLYVYVASTGDYPMSKRAERLAHELSADEIAIAQKRARVLLKRLSREKSR